MIVLAILESVKAVIFIDQHSSKTRFFYQVFHKGCLQNISTNPQITLDLRAFTEDRLNRKPQNLQNIL